MITSIFNNRNLDQFDPSIIERLFQHGARCKIQPPRSNTLNNTIILAARYIDSFEDGDKKLIAEQNAIKVIDCIIKNGAQPLNDDQGIDTLSLTMNCANINILKCLVKANLNLKSHVHDICSIIDCSTINRSRNNPNINNNCSTRHRSIRQTLEYALSASQKTSNPEFLRIAFSKGSGPCHCCSDTMKQILESQIISIVDCIVFGGDGLIRPFYWHFFDIVIHHMHRDITNREKIDILEMIVCTYGHKLPNKYFLSKPIEEFINAYHDLIDGKYLTYDKNSNEYCKSIEIKNRLESNVKSLIDYALVHEKYDGRKSIIENEIIALPIVCTDIIVEYELTPRFTIIDWSKY